MGDVGMVREVFRTLRAAADVPGIEISVDKGTEVGNEFGVAAGR